MWSFTHEEDRIGGVARLVAESGRRHFDKKKYPNFREGG